MFHTYETLQAFHSERVERLRRSYTRPGLLAGVRRLARRRRADRYDLAA
jgi:hypothetical protein